MSTELQPVVWRIRVKLKFNKRIYRDILILGNQTFKQLHKIIFNAFDRYDEHLYQFEFKKNNEEAELIQALMKLRGLRLPKLRKETILVASPECCGGYGGDAMDASKTMIDKFNFAVKMKFEYVFDFGDEWWHEIEVTGIVPFEPDTLYPRIIKEKGESPEQYSD
ncbi:MAG: plasmid pRiA4b ORF-3 family protein [Victivallaceae bacterium]